MKRNPNISHKLLAQQCICICLMGNGNASFLRSSFKNALRYHTGVPVAKISNKIVDIAVKEVLGHTVTSMIRAEKRFYSRDAAEK